MTTASAANPELIYALRRVSESAALAAFDWIGRGDGMDGGRAALDAMLAALAGVDMDAVVVIGEAGKGEAPQPARGERLGRPGSTFKADIAMDPVEGTSYLARGQTNALAVLAVAAAAVGMTGKEGDLFRRLLPWSIGLLVIFTGLVYLQSTPVLGWMVP